MKKSASRRLLARFLDDFCDATVPNPQVRVIADARLEGTEDTSVMTGTPLADDAEYIRSASSPARREYLPRALVLSSELAGY
jgi:hypothetical protein